MLQLPKQDFALAYCKHLDQQHHSSYQDFVNARNEIALDIAYVKEAPTAVVSIIYYTSYCFVFFIILTGFCVFFMIPYNIFYSFEPTTLLFLLGNKSILLKHRDARLNF